MGVGAGAGRGTPTTAATRAYLALRMVTGTFVVYSGSLCAKVAPAEARKRPGTKRRPREL